MKEEILKGERAEYGAGTLPTLSAKLIPQYGDGFSTGVYWRKLKERLGVEGSEPVTIGHGLKLEALDGKQCIRMVSFVRGKYD